MCYTSGTTGPAQGFVNYTAHSPASRPPHRCQTCSGISKRDVIMPIVPMFHVNAWGLPYSAALNGA